MLPHQQRNRAYAYMLTSRQSPPPRPLPKKIAFTYSSPKPPASSANSPRPRISPVSPYVLPQQQPRLSQPSKGVIFPSVANNSLTRMPSLKCASDYSRPPNYILPYRPPVQPVPQAPYFSQPYNPDYYEYQDSNGAKQKQPNESIPRTRSEGLLWRDPKSQRMRSLSISKQVQLTLPPQKVNSIQYIEPKETALPNFDTSTSTEIAQRPKTPTFSELPHPGLVNLGNTCYLNSVLQVLFIILQKDDFEIKTSKENVTQLFFLLKEKKTEENVQALIRGMMKLLPMFQSFGQQQDAHEFLIQFLQHLSQQSQMAIKKDADLLFVPTMSIEQNYQYFCNQMKKLGQSPITRLFAGQTLQNFTCQKSHITYRFHRFNHLELHFKHPQNPIQVSQLIKESLKDEIISGFRCSVCQSSQQKKKELIYKAPIYLILNLVRFSKENNLQKDKREVVFEQTLKIEENFNLAIFELMGIINHVGTKNKGHYYCYIKTLKGWHSFNDEVVLPFEFDDKKCCSAAAYILFYRRK